MLLWRTQKTSASLDLMVGGVPELYSRALTAEAALGRARCIAVSGVNESDKQSGHRAEGQRGLQQGQQSPGGPLPFPRPTLGQLLSLSLRI